jgi:hypothetical protein
MTQKKTPKHDPLSGKYCNCKTCKDKAIKKMRKNIKDLNDQINARTTTTPLQGFIPPFTTDSSNPTLDSKDEK